MSGGRHNYSDLDIIFHAPARLGIATALLTSGGGLSFSELKRACELTDGNRSRHLGRMEQDRVLSVEKGFINRRPHTIVKLSPDGRRRFEAYLEQVRSIVRPGQTGYSPGGELARE